MRHSKTLVLTVTAFLLTILAPAAFATCSDCYWAWDFTGHANDYAEIAIAFDDLDCTFPYGGQLAGIISFYMDEALQDGSVAYDEFEIAKNICSQSAAAAGETAVAEALAHAEDAWYYCQNNCQTNAACGSSGPVKKALNWYGYAKTQAGSCVAQCTNP